HAMNVKPKNYSWQEFYDHVIDVVDYTFNYKNIYRRFSHSNSSMSAWMNMMRAITAEGWGRLKYHKEVRRRFDTDPEFLPFFEGETTKLPQFYVTMIKKDLGKFYDWLPKGAMEHDAYAYLKASEAQEVQEVQVVA
ncbi:MAG: radical SAM protein, partial [Bacteroidota bacterium]